MDDATIAQLLDRAISWELTARDLYAALSKSFPSYPDVEDTWKQMAVDESRHASILRETRDVLSQSALSRPLDAAEAALIVSAEAELARAAALELRTLDDAHELAHRLESSEVSTVFQLLVSCRTDDFANKALLDAQFDGHIDRLKRLTDGFDRPTRRSIVLQT
jgi:rubrerythrin